MVTTSKSSIAVTGIPTEAGTHFPGQCKAPDALVSAGQLLSKLVKAGYTVSHEPNIFRHGPKEAHDAAKWHACPKVNGVRNEEDTLKVMQHIKWFMGMSSILERDERPIMLFIGGIVVLGLQYSQLCITNSPLRRRLD